jgi:Integral membrane protein TerC family
MSRGNCRRRGRGKAQSPAPRADRRLGVHATFIAWVALVAGLVSLLALDLLAVHRGAHEVSMRDAAWSTAGFIAISVALGVVLGLVERGAIAGQFFAGYVLEKSLSLDNPFVWALIFSSFRIPAAHQHRVLFYGCSGPWSCEPVRGRRGGVARALRLGDLRLQCASGRQRRARASVIRASGWSTRAARRCSAGGTRGLAC